MVSQKFPRLAHKIFGGVPHLVGIMHGLVRDVSFKDMRLAPGELLSVCDAVSRTKVLRLIDLSGNYLDPVTLALAAACRVSTGLETIVIDGVRLSVPMIRGGPGKFFEREMVLLDKRLDLHDESSACMSIVCSGVLIASIAMNNAHAHRLQVGQTPLYLKILRGDRVLGVPYDPKIELSNKYLKQDDAVIVAALMEHNSRARTLNLGDNGVGPPLAVAFSDVIRPRPSVSRLVNLDLSGNSIGSVLKKGPPPKPPVEAAVGRAPRAQIDDAPSTSTDPSSVKRVAGASSVKRVAGAALPVSPPGPACKPAPTRLYRESIKRVKRVVPDCPDSDSGEAAGAATADDACSGQAPQDERAPDIWVNPNFDSATGAAGAGGGGEDVGAVASSAQQRVSLLRELKQRRRERTAAGDAGEGDAGEVGEGGADRRHKPQDFGAAGSEGDDRVVAITAEEDNAPVDAEKAAQEALQSAIDRAAQKAAEKAAASPPHAHRRRQHEPHSHEVLVTDPLKALASALALNGTLRTLDLSRNNLGPPPAQRPARRRRVPHHLGNKHRAAEEGGGEEGHGGASDWDWDTSGLEALGRALRRNTRLTALSLRGNRLGDRGANALLDGWLVPDEATLEAEAARAKAAERAALGLEGGGGGSDDDGGGGGGGEGEGEGESGGGAAAAAAPEEGGGGKAEAGSESEEEEAEELSTMDILKAHIASAELAKKEAAEEAKRERKEARDALLGVGVKRRRAGPPPEFHSHTVDTVDFNPSALLQLDVRSNGSTRRLGQRVWHAFVGGGVESWQEEVGATPQLARPPH
jgi:hypothetical protein